MTDQVKKLDAEIASLETSIAEKTARLQVAQARWDDWRAGCLRAAIGQDQVHLHNLKFRRSSLAPMADKKASSIFYGSNN
jgi:hypothetical protein